MASSEDGYSEANINNESTNNSTYKTNTPNKQASSPNSSGSDKYNISNVLKHMYTLKYVQRQSVNQDKPSTAAEAVATAAASPSPFKANSSSKQFWMPDDQVKECFECNDKFTMFNRRHVIHKHFFICNYFH